jgi:ABC-type glycerol-3-phosphate transport system substrate-binding protein
VIHAILLNMTLFESAGLGVPTTWGEIQAAAKALTDPSKGTYGIQLSTWQTFTVPLLAAGGTKLFSDDLTKVAANTPGGVAAFEIVFQKIGWEAKSSVPLGFTDDQANALALEGKIGMMWREESGIKAVWRKQAPDIKLDVVPMPAVEGTEGKPSVWTNVGFLFLAESSKHKEDALKLLKFLATKHVQEEYVVKGVDLMSPMKGVVPTDVDPVVGKFLSYLPMGSGTQVSVNWREATVAFSQETEAIWSGQKTAKQALADLEAAVNPILDGS